MSYTISISDLDDLPAHLSELLGEWAEIVDLEDAGEVAIDPETREVETVRMIVRDDVTGLALRDERGRIRLTDAEPFEATDDKGIVLPVPPAVYEYLTELRK